MGSKVDNEDIYKGVIERLQKEIRMLVVENGKLQEKIDMMKQKRKEEK